MIRLLWTLGFSAVAILVLAAAIQEVVENWTRAVGLALGLGFIAGSFLYQFAHKSRYGYWFDPPSKPPE